MTSARTAPRRSRPTSRPARRVVRRPVRPAAVRRRPAGSTAARPGRRRGRRLRDVQLGWWAVVLVVLAVVTGVAWQADAIPTPTPPARCTVAGGSFTLTPEQAANARTIAAVAAARHLPERAVVIAVATALQETHLRNLPYGDRDSLGLFQQRPSQGWGTPAQVQDPVLRGRQVLRPPGDGARLGDRPADRRAPRPCSAAASPGPTSSGSPRRRPSRTRWSAPPASPAAEPAGDHRRVAARHAERGATCR